MRPLAQAAEKRKRLVIVADDFGKNHAINKAIVHLARKGSITGIAMMSNGDWFDEGVDELYESQSKVDVCAHLNVTDAVPMLSSQGKTSGIPLERFLVQMIFDQIDYSWVRDEFFLQIERFHSKQIKVHQLNTHHHVHLQPAILDILIEIANTYNVPYIRAPFEPFQSFRDLGSPRNCLKRLGRGNAQEFFEKLRKSNRRTASQFLGLYARPFLCRMHLDQLITRVRPGLAELICHPTYEAESADFATLDKISEQEPARAGISLTTFAHEGKVENEKAYALCPDC